MKDEECFNCMELIKHCKCEETEGYSSCSVICPYCGYGNPPEDSDGILYDESTDEYCCGLCGKDFNVDLYVSYLWTTRRK